MTTFPCLSIKEIRKIPKPKWLIRDMIKEKSLTVMFGPPGSCKSFLALSMSLHLAHGIEWRGKVLQRTGVAYVAGEGVGEFANRLDAWHIHQNMPVDNDNENFTLIPKIVNLLDCDKGDGKPTETTELIETLRARQDELEIKFSVVIIDTLARAMVGGNENSQEWMSIAVANADRIKDELGCAILLIHHTGLAEGRARGSTVLKCGADGEHSVTKEDHPKINLHVLKMKDSKDGFDIAFEKVEIDLPPDEEGEPQSSLVIVPMVESDGEQISVNEDRAIKLATNAPLGVTIGETKALLLIGMSKGGKNPERLAMQIVTKEGRTVRTIHGLRRITPLPDGKYRVDEVDFVADAVRRTRGDKAA